jgi:hypothetical protein
MHNIGNTSDFGGMHDTHIEHNSEDQDLENSSNKSVSLDDQVLGKL